LEEFLDSRAGVSQGEGFRLRHDQTMYQVDLLERVTDILEVCLVRLVGRVGLRASYVISVGEHGGKLGVRIVTIPRKRSRIDLVAGPAPGEKIHLPKEGIAREVLLIDMVLLKGSDPDRKIIMPI
jgi:hypothetical protein